MEDNVIETKLKFKGNVQLSTKRKKKSKKDKKKDKKRKKEKKQEIQEEEPQPIPLEQKEIEIVSTKTEAEKNFEMTQKLRKREKIEKLANKSYRDKLKDYNSFLDTLSEHHDIPKVGPG
eukprot:TRINITY_DN1029_c0_g1_i1.p1 TRINITY_DN1029_c0_g1~~TRINITY_DN1029_c0_g1_i1.p1  ORF type:complete len:119 (+),score=47.07 TRINITY_DN1029_c0_g1_i1:99-455(+)